MNAEDPEDEVAMLINEGLELLTEDQCRALLATAVVGRVGVTVGGLPVITPVNFAYVGDDVVFRSSEGTKLRAATAGAVIAFEVDAYDEQTRLGWSVLAVGRAAAVTDPDDLERLRTQGIATWAGGTRDNYVRLHPELLSGRRIVGG